MFWIETVMRSFQKRTYKYENNGCKFIEDDHICIDGKREITSANLLV